MTGLVALPDGTELAGDYKIERVLGAGGFGVTYLAREKALSRRVSIKEYFPSDFATRSDGRAAAPRSKASRADYNWGLERFWEEGQTLARFNHPNIVKVHRMFRANNTAYMVLHFEEGLNLKAWLKKIGRAPRQAELDAIVAPLLDALTVIHGAAVLHRDIAPDNIIIRKSGDPVLIDFGAARGDIAAHSKTKTVSALVKPGYSPYEQYAETSRQQGPWTDIYALAATLYHAVCGKRPPDSPSRMLKDELIPARQAALGGYRSGFLDAIDRGLALAIDARPQSIADWRAGLMAPQAETPKPVGNVIQRMKGRTEARRVTARARREAAAAAASTAAVLDVPMPPPPDAPGPKGGLLDFVEALRKPAAIKPEAAAPAPLPAAKPETGRLAADIPAQPAKAAAVPAVIDAKPLPRVDKRARRAAGANAKSRRRWTRGLRRKLVMAACIATTLIVYRDQIPRFIAGPGVAMRVAERTDLTTGALPLAARETSRRIPATAELKIGDTAIDALRLSGDGRLIVAITGDGRLLSFAADSHARRADIVMDEGRATSLAVRNNRAVTTHHNGAVVVYDLDSNRRLQSFKRNDVSIWTAAFAGSEDVVAAAGQDGTVALWESGVEAPVKALDGHKSSVQALATDTSGKWLASGSADRTVKLWSLDRRQIRRTLRGHRDDVSALAFSPDGRQIAAGTLGGSVKLWSVSTGRDLRTIRAHDAPITAIAYAPDGSFLATASRDGRVRIRGLNDTRFYGTLEGMASGATTLAFTGDGQTLMTGGDDGIVRFWSLPAPKLAQQK